MDGSERSPDSPVSQATNVGESGRAASSGLTIAILGPGLKSDDTAGIEKRKQIRKSLAADGHLPFFPEDEGLLVPEHPVEPLLFQESRLLGDPEVRLVIFLYRPASIGVGFEIAHFLAHPKIKAKSAVLYPSDHYMPNDSLAADTVRAFRARLPYTEEHFNVCQLVDECRKWASDIREDLRSDIVPFSIVTGMVMSSGIERRGDGITDSVSS